MSSHYLDILQLANPWDLQQLDQAYRSSVARYQRLTRSGPLRYYRHDLLADAEQAYETLKKEHHQASSSDSVFKQRNPYPPTTRESILHHRAAQCGRDEIDNRPPVKSPVKGYTILEGQPVTLQSRSVGYQRRRTVVQPNESASREQAQWEDRFCREVIYRLEGDLIRHTNRQHLLTLAKEWDIALFRANMLIAQIVEAVRQNKLYETVPGKAVRVQIVSKSPNRYRFWIVSITVAAIVLLEYWLIRRWGSS